MNRLRKWGALNTGNIGKCHLFVFHGHPVSCPLVVVGGVSKGKFLWCLGERIYHCCHCYLLSYLAKAESQYQRL